MDISRPDTYTLEKPIIVTMLLNVPVLDCQYNEKVVVGVTTWCIKHIRQQTRLSLEHKDEGGQSQLVRHI